MTATHRLYLVDFVFLLSLSLAVRLALVMPQSQPGYMDAAYSYDIDDDNLYSLSLTTGSKTLIGNIGFNANFGQGLTRDSVTGNMYMVAFNNLGLDAQLRMVDLNTGNTTYIGSIIPGELSQFGWGSFQQARLRVYS